MPEFRFVIQHTISEKRVLATILAPNGIGLSPLPTLIYNIAKEYSFTDKLVSYIELFGFAPQKKIENHTLDGGFTYLINNNFMLDLSSGIGITNNAPDHYVALGFSFRI